MWSLSLAAHSLVGVLVWHISHVLPHVLLHVLALEILLIVLIHHGLAWCLTSGWVEEFAVLSCAPTWLAIEIT